MDGVRGNLLRDKLESPLNGADLNHGRACRRAVPELGIIPSQKGVCLAWTVHAEASR